MSRLSPLALVTGLCFCPTAFADKPAAAPRPATTQQVHQAVERSLSLSPGREHILVERAQMRRVPPRGTPALVDDRG